MLRRLGDLWDYNTEIETWSAKKMIGDPPMARSGYSTCTMGYNIYLYGGEGDLSLYQDFFVYDSEKETWQSFDLVDWPPARKHACMICDFPRFYILGGITINGYVSEVWEIDLQALTVKLLSENAFAGPKPFAYSQCFSEHIDDQLNINVFYGETQGQYPLEPNFIYNTVTDKWSDVKSFRIMSRTSIVKIKDRMIMAGGENWGLFSFDGVYAYDLAQETEVYIGTLPRKMYLVASAYLGSTIYIHGGGDTLGKKYRQIVPISTFVKVQLNEESEIDWECSAGTYLEKDQCKPCPPGTFSDDYGSSCKDCPKGTASRSYGNASLQQCKPCKEGYFAAEARSSLCLQCPWNFFCPVGNSSPIYAGQSLSGIKSSQPALYSSKIGYTNTINLYIQFGLLFLGLLVLVVFVALREKKRYFRTFDLFKKNHNHFVDEVMYIRKQPIGGLFSLWFVLLALLFIVISLTDYLIDNIEETKALVPLVAVEEKYDTITADFNLTTIFKDFNGDCQKESMCKVEVEQVSGHYTVSCVKVENSCMISVKCYGCEMNTGSKVKYFMLDSFSYSTGISVNMTSTSSIPDEYSSIEQSIVADKNYVFRGPDASQIFFEITPSVRVTQIFSSQANANQEDSTGFHIAATKAAVLGSQVVITE